MLSAPVAVSREMCGTAIGASFACGTMDVAGLTPSIPFREITIISAFVQKERHTRRPPR
jgi:hypothetical protein